MSDYELKDLDPEDIEDLLKEVETSFDIKFVANELTYVKTFGELCGHIANKIQLENSNDCTSQQAFYKLRDAISTCQFEDKSIVKADYPLNFILPRRQRRLRVNKLEKHLGFRLNILNPPDWVLATFGIAFVTSLVWLFFNWKIGVSGLSISIVGILIANKTGIELNLKTVGEVAEKMTRENYLKSRRNFRSFNKREVERVLTDWFSKSFYLDKSKLTRETELY